MASSKRGLPPHLAAARQRTADEKLAMVQKLKEKIEADAKAGLLTRPYIEKLGLATFCKEAGVSENYLNGDNLRGTVKPAIKKLIADLKNELRYPLPSEDDSSDEGDLTVTELQVQNARLLSMLHAARLQLHSQRQIIKRLQARVGPTVVPIKGN